MKQETTVDFLVQFSNGNYWTKAKTNTDRKKNHLSAYSFHTRADAERVKPKTGIVIKRTSILEDLSDGNK